MNKNTSRARDLTGQRFGRLIVLSRESNRPNCTDAIWKCRCDCGGENIVRASHLRSGNVSSCGCYNREQVSKAKRTHGMDRTRTYYIWAGMKQRCRNPRQPMYSGYGGRGIDVCDRWHDSFEAFLADMGQSPDGMSLERIDNNRGYEPGNCRWATSKEQGRNKRNNRVLTANGETHTLSEWAELTGIAKSTIHGRLKRGLSDEEALAA